MYKDEGSAVSGAAISRCLYCPAGGLRTRDDLIARFLFQIDSTEHVMMDKLMRKDFTMEGHQQRMASHRTVQSPNSSVPSPLGTDTFSVMSPLPQWVARVTIDLFPPGPMAAFHPPIRTSSASSVGSRER